MTRLELTTAPQVLAVTRDLVEPALRAAVSTMADDRMRLITKRVDSGLPSL